MSRSPAQPIRTARGALVWLGLALTLTCGGAARAGGPDLDRLSAARALAASHGAEVRWDEETGVPARVALSGAREEQGAPEALAAALLERELAPLFERGLRVALEPEAGGAGSHLVLRERRALAGGGLWLRFAQQVGEWPVQDAELAVELAPGELGWRALRVTGRYYPALNAELVSQRDPNLEFTLLEQLPAYRSGELEAAPALSRVVVVSAGVARPALRVEAIDPSDERAYRTFYDAASGAVLQRYPTTCEAEAEGLAYAKNPGDTPRAAVPLSGLYVYQGNNRVTTDAQGRHPLTGTVTLNDALAGPLLRVFAHGEDELTYAGPADLSLRPREAEVAQDELAAWHHIHNFNAHLRATYAPFRNDGALDTRFALLVRYKSNGQPLRNAFFTPQNVTVAGESFTGYLAMGTFSGREAARSGTVVQHEYCHALYSEIVSLAGSLQAGGLNEGLSDYFPAAFHEDGLLGAWLVPPAGIRDLSRRYVWPRDDNGDVHRVGHIFAGSLWRAREAARARGEQGEIDQAVAAGVFRLRARPNLLDAREAILAGDRAVNAGKHRVLLADSFNAHGIGPAARNAAPTLTGLSPERVAVGDTLVVALQLDDPDGDPLSVTLSPLANASYDAQRRELSFLPDATQEGLHSVVITVSDGALTTSETLEIEVLPPTGLQLPRSPGLASTAPTASSTAAAATVAPAAPRSGGGGGGGCTLAASPAPGFGSLLLSLLTLAVLGGARRRAEVA